MEMKEREKKWNFGADAIGIVGKGEKRRERSVVRKIVQDFSRRSDAFFATAFPCLAASL